MATSSTVKVFCGNLPFSLSQDDLKAAFSGVGKVIDAQLIMRGSRSLGYGFVEMASEADAQAAVRALHKKAFDGREINVEIARSRVTDEELAARAAKPRRRTRNRGEGAERGNAGGDGGQPRQQSSSTGGGQGGNAGGEGRQGGRRPRNAGGAGGAGGARTTDNADRPLSETTVFVANLPFSVTSAELLEFFKAAKAVDAVVSCRPSGRSKGFGFVKLAKGDVAGAVASMDGKQLADRKLTVRVAMTEFEVEKTRNESIQASNAGGKDGGDVPKQRAAAQE